MADLQDFTKFRDLVHEYNGTPPWEPPMLFTALGFQIALMFLNIFTWIWIKTWGREHKITANLKIMMWWSLSYSIASTAYLAARYRDFFILMNYSSYLTPSYVMYVLMMSVHFSMIGNLMLSWMEIVNIASIDVPRRNWKFIKIMYTAGLWTAVFFSYLISAILFWKAPVAAGIVMVVCLGGFVMMFVFVLFYFLAICKKLHRAIQNSKISTDSKQKITTRFVWLSAIFATCLVSQVIYLTITVTNPYTGDPVMFYPMLMLPMYVSSIQSVMYFSPIPKLARRKIRFILSITVFDTSEFEVSVSSGPPNIEP